MLRYALRKLIRDRAFTTMSVLSLALGIGMATAAFAVAYGVLLHPLPYPAAQELVRIGKPAIDGRHPGTASYPEIQQWQAAHGPFQSIAYWSLSLEKQAFPHGTRELVAVHCSPDLLTMLQVHPILGTGFGSRQDRVAIIGNTTWREVFHSDRGAIGQSIRIGNGVYTIVGVMSDRIIFPLTQDALIAWTPAQPDPAWSDPNQAMLEVIGRLQPKASPKAAESALNALPSLPNHGSPGSRILVQPYRASVTESTRPTLLLLLTAAMVIWLMACFNSLGFVLSQAAVRRKEMTVQVALGMTPWRRAQQCTFEALLLAAVAGVVGAGLADWTLTICRQVLVYSLPFAREVALTAPVLIFVLSLVVLSAVGLGLVPVAQSLAAHPGDLLKGGTQIAGFSPRQRIMRDAVVVGQVAFAVMLTIVAGLLFRTIQDMHAAPLGFHPDHLLVTQVPLPDAGKNDPNIASDFYAPLLDNLQKIAGVRRVALATALPFSPNLDASIPVQLPGVNLPVQNARAQVRIVSDDYYKTLGIRLKSGRVFNSSDAAGAAWSVIVNEAFVRAFLPNQDPVGREIRTYADGPHKFSTIVGVVEDVRQKSIQDASVPEVDICFKRIPDPDQALYLHVFGEIAIQTTTDPAALISPVTRVLQKAEPQTVLFPVTLMAGKVRKEMATQLFAAQIIGVMALVCLLSALAGTMSLISYNVSRSTRELAVRLALGAQPQQLVRMVMVPAVRNGVLGICCGGLFAFWAVRLIETLLFRVSPHDPATILTVTAAMLAGSSTVGYLAGRRAARIDPALCLR